ncbi:hypothetical protein [Fictibacillus sp. FJAT-27399]|uniref:hypothetical protein n=1 Tax=Fictibacillus sp. FJAT-27399 TaxID=1729689 RepID=UPI000783F058|nr:hypothetical protein [Fictibacillus sp. FJAT-27399]
MKKFMSIAAVLLLVLSVGCSQEKEAKGQEKPKSETSSDKNKEKSAVLDFEVELGAKLREYHAPFNAYAAALDPEKKTPKADLEKLAAAAKDSGEKAAKEIPELKVPSSLTKEDQDVFKTAFKDLSQSYKTRAEGLGDEAKTAEADKQFSSFAEKVNTIHKKLGLIEASFVSEIQ